MNESGETFSEEYINPEEYLESLGPVNKENITTVTSLIKKELGERKLDGFLVAVGGTVEKPEPHNRKDIDLKLGIEPDPNINGQDLKNQYRLNFERMNELVRAALSHSDKKFEIGAREPESDPDNPSKILLDGLMTVKPLDGTPIEIICDQSGKIEFPFVELFSTVALQKAG